MAATETFRPMFKEGGVDDASHLGLVADGRQSTGDSADPCRYCDCIDGHTSDCWEIS